MKVFLTGATGFIGGHLAEALAEAGHELVCLVRKTSDTARLEKLGARLEVCDLLDRQGVDGVIARARPEAAVHCAADVMDNDVERLYRHNALGTYNVSEACFAHHVKRLVYLSSIAVVNGNDKVPLDDGLPYKARNAYGRSKIDAEKIAVNFRKKGLPTAILRPCIVYGEREPHAWDLIMKLVRWRLLPAMDHKGMDLPLGLVYVGNVVRAARAMLGEDGALEGTFIIADEGAISLRRLLDIVYDEMHGARPPCVPAGVASMIVSLPFVGKSFRGLFRERTYDISRISRLPGYSPAVDTEEGLRRSVRYWKQQNM